MTNAEKVWVCYGKVNGSCGTKTAGRFLLSAPPARVSGDARSQTRKTSAAAGALATVALLVSAPAASAAGARDATADVLAGRDVTLTGDTVVTVPSGTTTYDGLRLADTTYRISYRGGDGNDVVLTAAPTGSSSPTAHPKTSSGTTLAEARTTDTARGDSFGWWPYALGLGLLGGLLVPVTRRTRGGDRRGGGRRAA
ncbi:hypothetical protein ACWDG9_30315 [Streptomyces sp. NPDC001073]